MSYAYTIYLLAIFLLIAIISSVSAFPEQGKWDYVMSKEKQLIVVPKSLFTGSHIRVYITCDSSKPDTNITISWKLQQSPCWEDFDALMFEGQVPYALEGNASSYHFTDSPIYNRLCIHGGHIILEEHFLKEPENQLPKPEKKQDSPGDENTVFTITRDGVYYFLLTLQSSNDFNASVHVEMKATYGFLSAVDYPLLPFYLIMCLVYVVFGIIWLTVSFMQWRDLLRIQFWIGGVILLGMLEKAMFYAEYQGINSNGVSVQGAVLVAEWVSCAKRTLARMLVIIVSLGFGIVKPRLGPMLHRVVGTGTLYFVLACVESYLRVMHVKNDPSNRILVASIPLAVLDSAICWWIFTSLVQTTRTLRLRRNMVKLALYRHFTNTLIFAVIASVIFMLFSIKTHRLSKCLQNWKELWQDEAFWHVLFSLLLSVIMILWRPTNNNQRYAFTPLLDNPEDEDDEEEEEEQFVSDAYGVKMRGARSSSPKPSSRTTTNDEDDLRWVEENIPTAIADAALPVLDSDEEILNTKFEVSKMQ
ncbi:transmembrane protein 87A isoform X2 [Bradysia coprophila]|uniref:transmembrane protein 87A isoform X2 n=1 Tax=Bradysia coprophila TaxID=38358 RepID=UPI00187DD738|nr:transmembrane protein 87A isoform X2 [Bradysia coprophila]